MRRHRRQVLLTLLRRERGRTWIAPIATTERHVERGTWDGALQSTALHALVLGKGSHVLQQEWLKVRGKQAWGTDSNGKLDVLWVRSDGGRGDETERSWKWVSDTAPKIVVYLGAQQSERSKWCKGVTVLGYKVATHAGHVWATLDALVQKWNSPVAEAVDGDVATQVDSAECMVRRAAGYLRAQ